MEKNMSRSGRIIQTNEPSFTSNLSGMWKLNEITGYINQNKWPTIPESPTNLSGAVGNAQIELSWTAPSTRGLPITNYEVEYTPSGGSASTVLTGSTSAAYTLTGLTNGTEYSVRVRAVSAAGNGEYSAAVTGTPVNFSPQAVVLMTGTSYSVPIGASTMKAWAVGGGGSANDDDPSIISSHGAIAYKTWAVAGGDSVSLSIGPVAEFWSNNGGNTSITYDGVTITAEGAKTEFSNATAAFSGGDGGLVGPRTVRDQVGTLGLNTDNVPATRHIPREFEGILAAVNLAGQQGNIQNYNMPDGQAVTASNFGYGRATNTAPWGPGGGAGYYQWSGGHRHSPGAVVLLFTATPVAAQPPGQVTNLAGTAGNAQIALTWTAPASELTISDYEVEYTPSGGSASTVLTGSTSASYTLTGLTNGTEYSVRVRAVSAAGNGEYSAAVTGTPVGQLVTYSSGGTPTSVSGSGTQASPLVIQRTSGNSTVHNIYVTAQSGGRMYFRSVLPSAGDPTGLFYRNGTALGGMENGTEDFNFLVNIGDTVRVLFEYPDTYTVTFYIIP